MKLKFISKHRQTKGVFSFWFEPLEPITWTAGQSIRLEIEGEERRFTISHPPHQNNICITTRLRKSDFKQNLAKLAPGQVIDGYNIEGGFVWVETPKPKIFIAAGIGITPYYAIVKQLDYLQKPINVTLLYFNHDQDFLFGEELRRLHQKHPRFTIVFLPRQQINSSVISVYKPTLLTSLIYISGPENMVQYGSTLLSGLGVRDTNIRRDLFTGYSY